jgi:hypothetical protein
LHGSIPVQPHDLPSIILPNVLPAEHPSPQQYSSSTVICLLTQWASRTTSARNHTYSNGAFRGIQRFIKEKQ